MNPELVVDVLELRGLKHDGSHLVELDLCQRVKKTPLVNGPGNAKKVMYSVKFSLEPRDVRDPGFWDSNILFISVLHERLFSANKRVGELALTLASIRHAVEASGEVGSKWYSLRYKGSVRGAIKLRMKARDFTPRAPAVGSPDSGKSSRSMSETSPQRARKERGYSDSRDQSHSRDQSYSRGQSHSRGASDSRGNSPSRSRSRSESSDESERDNRKQRDASRPRKIEESDSSDDSPYAGGPRRSPKQETHSSDSEDSRVDNVTPKKSEKKTMRDMPKASTGNTSSSRPGVSKSAHSGERMDQSSSRKEKPKTANPRSPSFEAAFPDTKGLVPEGYSKFNRDW